MTRAEVEIEVRRARAAGERANLSGADLRYANLGDADLRDANLSGADLGSANLRDADLRGADLGYANLGSANLRDADLRDADLGGADLGYADLGGADLSGAELSGADLGGADLSGAELSGANLSGADLGSGVDPSLLVVPHIDAQIACAIGDNGNKLDMSDWHKCGTTHCRAGWAITLAGEAGARLESSHGPAAAGAIIYALSRPTKPIPDFYCDTDTAMESILDDAADAQEEV